MKHTRLRNMICGLCDIADGLIVILTLGNYYPALTFKFVAWAELREIRKRKTKC